MKITIKTILTNKFKLTISRWTRIDYANVLFAILIVIVIVLFFVVSRRKYVPLGAAASGIIALYLGLIKYWLDSDAIFRSLFESFNKRFDDLNDNLNNIHNYDGINRDAVIQDYLNLCAEEYFWYKKGRIPPTVWESWKQGILYYIKDESIKEYFRGQKAYNRSYYGFFNELKCLDDQRPDTVENK